MASSKALKAVTEVAPENPAPELIVPPPYNPMHLWDELARTDPKATKSFQKAGGFKGTQIDPAWRIKRMTEVFGPVGKGWGYEQLEWTIAERMVFICCRGWYIDPQTGEKHYTGPQWGGNELVRKNRDGSERPDDEGFKMAMTDAMGKSLLQIGLAADVFLGQFDDSKYRDESAQIYSVKNSDPAYQPGAINKLEEDIKAAVAGADSIDALKGVHTDNMDHLKNLGKFDKPRQERLLKAIGDRKSELLKREEAKAAPEDVPEAPTQEPQPEDPASEPAPPAAEAPAAAQEAKSTEPAFETLIVEPQGDPKDWVSFGKRAIVAVRSIQAKETLLKWRGRHKQYLDQLDAIEADVVGQRGTEPNTTPILAKEIRDTVILEMRRRNSKISGTNLTLRWADGHERDVFADPADWTDGLANFLSPTQFHNIKPNVEQAEQLMADATKRGDTELFNRLTYILTEYTNLSTKKNAA